MREILFRGKRVDNGEWVYGFYTESCAARMGTIIENDNDDYCVDPATVGQYTGLTDRNRKRIFKGDIVEFQFDNDDCPFPNKDTKKRVGRVFFKKFRASFAIAMGQNGSSGINNDLFKYVQGGNRVSVIGNIHDHPELLKESE